MERKGAINITTALVAAVGGLLTTVGIIMIAISISREGSEKIITYERFKLLDYNNSYITQLDLERIDSNTICIGTNDACLTYSGEDTCIASGHKICAPSLAATNIITEFINGIPVTNGAANVLTFPVNIGSYTITEDSPGEVSVNIPKIRLNGIVYDTIRLEDEINFFDNVARILVDVPNNKLLFLAPNISFLSSDTTLIGGKISALNGLNTPVNIYPTTTTQTLLHLHGTTANLITSDGPLHISAGTEPIYMTDITVSEMVVEQINGPNITFSGHITTIGNVYTNSITAKAPSAFTDITANNISLSGNLIAVGNVTCQQLNVTTLSVDNFDIDMMIAKNIVLGEPDGSGGIINYGSSIFQGDTTFMIAGVSNGTTATELTISNRNLQCYGWSVGKFHSNYSNCFPQCPYFPAGCDVQAEIIRAEKSFYMNSESGGDLFASYIDSNWDDVPSDNHFFRLGSKKNGNATEMVIEPLAFAQIYTEAFDLEFTKYMCLGRRDVNTFYDANNTVRTLDQCMIIGDAIEGSVTITTSLNIINKADSVNASLYSCTDSTLGDVFVMDGANLLVKGNIYATGTVTGSESSGGCTVPSDIRLKRNIETVEVDESLEIINKLNVVEYNYNETKDGMFKLPTGRHRGFIANELKEFYPRAVSRDIHGYYEINYSEILPDIVNYIKSSESRISKLEEEVKLLREILNDNIAYFHRVAAQC